MNFYETVLKVLKQDKRFFAEDGTFLRNAVYESAMQMDEDLIQHGKGSVRITPQYTASDNLTNFNYWLDRNKEGTYSVRLLKDA